MAYVKQLWTPNVTPVDAAHLNHIEDGIAAIDGSMGAGLEIGYDQAVAPVNITGTTPATAVTVIPGSAHTFDGNPVMFDFQAPYMQTDPVANSYTFAALFEGGVEVARLSITAGLTASANYQTVRGAVRFTPSAGVHTYSVKAWATSGTGVFGAGAGGVGQYGPAFLRATSVMVYNGPSAGLPQPVQNGKWVKGVGGAAVWSAITPADVANIPYGVNLPAAPYDGQEAILVDAVANPNYRWRFRYNAGSTNAYKWEFIGGDRLYLGVADFNNTTGASVFVYTNSGLIFPRAGDYEVTIEAAVFNASGAAVAGYYQWAANGAGIAAALPGIAHCTLLTGEEANVALPGGVYNIVAGTQFQIGHLMTSQPVHFTSVTVILQPKRVS